MTATYTFETPTAVQAQAFLVAAAALLSVRVEMVKMSSHLGQDAMWIVTFKSIELPLHLLQKVARSLFARQIAATIVPVNTPTGDQGGAS